MFPASKAEDLDLVVLTIEKDVNNLLIEEGLLSMIRYNKSVCTYLCIYTYVFHTLKPKSIYVDVDICMVVFVFGGGYAIMNF